MSIDINTINNWEKEIIFSLSLLPIAPYSIPELAAMFKVDESEKVAFFDTIHDLSTKGILNRNRALYKIDSDICKNILTEHKPTAEQCATIINYFSEKLEINKFDYDKEFMPLFSQLKSILEKVNGYTLHLAQLSYLLSSNLVKHKKYNEALKYNQKAVEISEAVDNKHPVVALFYRDKALIYKILGNSTKAIYYSLKDIKILEKHAGKYDDLLPDSYFALSKTYEAVQNYEKAAEYNLKAIQFEKKRDKRKSLSISSLYHKLAYYYIKLNNLRNASRFINKAVEASDEGKHTNKKHYKILLRDQKRFNSLFEFEQFILKYKNIMLVLAGLFLIILGWAIVSLII